MILCVNLNAAIDKTAVLPTFSPGQIHRPETVKMLPGGKGFNVARALKQLGETPVVTGWVGGSAGQFIAKAAQEEGIQTEFVYTAAESRTCLSILDSSSGLLTEIYEQGEAVPPEKVAELLGWFGKNVGRFTAVTLSGSLPPGVPPNIYAQLIHLAHKANVPAYLDGSQEALRLGVAAKPFLIKPNDSEIAILAERDLNTRADFAAAAGAISNRYQTIVALSLGKAGAIFAQGPDLIYVQPPRVQAKGAVGSGDSMLAGLVHGFGQGKSLGEAARCGVAAGTANTLVLGAGQFTRQDFVDIFAKTKISLRP